MSEQQIVEDVCQDLLSTNGTYIPPREVDEVVHATMKWLILHAERTPTDRPELEGWHNEGHATNNDPILDWLIRMRDTEV